MAEYQVIDSVALTITAPLFIPPELMFTFDLPEGANIIKYTLVGSTLTLFYQYEPGSKDYPTRLLFLAEGQRTSRDLDTFICYENFPGIGPRFVYSLDNGSE